MKKERSRTLKNKMKDSSSSTFWKTVIKLLGPTNGLEKCQIIDAEGLLIDTNDFALIFAEFFKTKVETLAQKNLMTYCTA